MNQGPRLPVLPLVPHSGPMVSPPAPIAAPDDFESELIDLGTNLPVGDATGGGERTLYTTKRRWRACDVYLQTDAQNFPGVFSIFVWGITRGVRSLVASGRFQLDTGGAGISFDPVWIVAARAVCERFEVTAIFHDAAGGLPDGRVRIAVVASDEAVEAPPFLGAIRFAGNSSFALGGVAVSHPWRPELVGISAVNGGAAARYFQVHFIGGGAIAPGRVPEMVFPLGNASGFGFADYKLRIRVDTDRESLFAWAISSTPQTLTNAADGRWTVWIR